MRKNTRGSSKDQAKAKTAAKIKARLKKSSPQTEEPKKSTVTEPTPNSETSVKLKPLDGAMKIDHLPFKQQADMIFNPLASLSQKSVVGKDSSLASVSAFTVDKK